MIRSSFLLTALFARQQSAHKAAECGSVICKVSCVVEHVTAQPFLCWKCR